MNVKAKVEGLGQIQKTDKGFIRQFLTVSPDGKKDVIKVFSKEAEKIAFSGPGELELRQDFFFA